MEKELLKLNNKKTNNPAKIGKSPEYTSHQRRDTDTNKREKMFHTTCHQGNAN